MSTEKVSRKNSWKREAEPGLAELLVEERELAGLTQAQAAEKLNVGVRYLKYLEHGLRSPSPKLRRRMGELYAPESDKQPAPDYVVRDKRASAQAPAPEQPTAPQRPYLDPAALQRWRDAQQEYHPSSRPSYTYRFDPPSSGLPMPSSMFGRSRVAVNPYIGRPNYKPRPPRYVGSIKIRPN